MARRYIKEQQKGQVDVLLLWRVLLGNFIKIGVVAVLLAAALGLYRYTNAEPYYNLDTKFLMNGLSYHYASDTNELVQVVANPNSSSALNIAYNAPYIINEDKALNNICEYLKKNYG